MLSTSNKTKFQYQYLLIAVVIILAMVSVLALYQSGVLPTISVGQPATQNLSALSAADASAYRWDAIARFYDGQSTTQNLTSLNTADASAYRWEAMAKFYAMQASAAALSWPSRPDFSILNQQTIIPVTGGADGLAIYHSSERGTFAAVQNGMSIYHQSERNAAQAPAFHYTSPGR